jgi:hypothetical protein
MRGLLDLLDLLTNLTNVLTFENTFKCNVFYN